MNIPRNENSKDSEVANWMHHAAKLQASNFELRKLNDEFVSALVVLRRDCSRYRRAFLMTTGLAAILVIALAISLGVAR